MKAKIDLEPETPSPTVWTLSLQRKVGDVMTIAGLRRREDGSLFCGTSLEVPGVRVVRILSARPDYQLGEIELLPPFDTSPVRRDPREKAWYEKS